jgi:hypothetical protein
MTAERVLHCAQKEGFQVGNVFSFFLQQMADGHESFIPIFERWPRFTAISTTTRGPAEAASRR